MANHPVRAVGLLSGGLDSTLAAKLMLEEGIGVFAVNFTSPFCTCTPKTAGCAAVITAIRQLGGIPLKRVALGDEYLGIVRDPEHGHGSGMNPCIDCRIMKIRKAGEYMHDIGAAFLFTGEVLGQRPMSQHRESIDTIDRESGLRDYILRPLSAGHFGPTIPERRGWVDRSRMLRISGRSRRIQITLAAQKGIRDYPCPAGGCLLTDCHFSDRIRDYFAFTAHPTVEDMPLLRIGRHFRLGCGSEIIVARDEKECRMLERHCRRTDHLLVPIDFAGPTVVLQGSAVKAAVRKMLTYTKARICGTGEIEHIFGNVCETIPIGEAGRQ